MDGNELTARLDELDTAALLMTLVHLRGDLTALHGRSPRLTLSPVAQGAGAGEGLVDGFSKAEADAIKSELLALIEAGATPPRTLSSEEIDEMIRFLVGGDPGAHIAPLLRELASDGPRPADPVPGADRFLVAIIGSGQGGIAMAIRLAQLGVPYLIFEKNSGVGGTWFENAYPGVRVDVPGHTYSYSYAPNADWSAPFPEGEEIRAYYAGVADRFDVTRRIRFETEVVAAEWEEEAGEWILQIRSKAGEEQLRFRAVVSAVGQLNRPRWPDLPGLDSFEGKLVHSAIWPKGLSLDGLRVGLIGSGATAFQIIPKIEKVVDRLVVFQRSPAWMFPNPIYHSVVSDAARWGAHTLPHYLNWHRFNQLHSSFEGVYAQTRIDPEWTDPRATSASNDLLREMMTRHISYQVSDPALLQKLVPTYPPFGKRILQDEGSYLRALQSERTTLDTGRIARVTPTGVLMEDGTAYQMDILVCATGFHADRFLAPMEIRGRDGILLSNQWKGMDSRAYLGIAIPNFPNLFCVYGPNTNWVVAGSIVINAEYQASYIGECIAQMIRKDKKAIEVHQVAHDIYNDEIDALNGQSAWGAAAVTNWYKNSSGRVTANMPLRPIEYWTRLRKPDFSAYELR